MASLHFVQVPCWRCSHVRRARGSPTRARDHAGRWQDHHRISRPGPAMIRSTTPGNGSVIRGAARRRLYRNVTRAWRGLLPSGVNVHVGPAHGITAPLSPRSHILIEDDLFDHTRLVGYDRLLMGRAHLARAAVKAATSRSTSRESPRHASSMTGPCTSPASV